MAAKCPMDGCDYSGATRSVEAHISGSSDEAHSGQLGRNWRSNIEDSHEDSTPAVEPDERAEMAKESATEAPTTDTSSEGLEVPPALGLVGATVLLVIVLVVASVDDGSGESEPAGEIEDETGEDIEIDDGPNVEQWGAQ